MAHIPIVPGDATAAEAPGSRPGPHDEEIARLQDLHTRLIDMLDGYEKVLEKAEPEFVGVITEFQDLHLRQLDRVIALLQELGREPASDGSMMGTVNRAVVEVRSWFDDIGHNVLGAIADGEKRLLGDFDAAIEVTPSVDRRARIDQMRGETVTLLQRHSPDQL